MTFGSSRLPVMVVWSSSTWSVTLPRAARRGVGGADEDAGALVVGVAVGVAVMVAVAVTDGVAITVGDSAGVGGAALADKAQPAVNQNA